MKDTRLLLAAVAGMTYRSQAGDLGSGPDFGATVSAADATKQAVPSAINEFVTMNKTPFHFKTDKDVELKDDAGKVIEVIKGKKPPSVDIYLPVPKASRIVQFLSSEDGQFTKEKELVTSAIAEIIFRAARGQINDFREKSPSEPVTPAIIDYDKLDFTAIANMPKGERGSFVPAEEDVKAFLASYLEHMPAITGKEPAKIQNHVDIIATGFKKQRAQKEMLEFFSDALSMYIAKAPEAAVEEHADVVEYYVSRLERMLRPDDKIVTMNDL